MKTPHSVLITVLVLAAFLPSCATPTGSATVHPASTTGPAPAASSGSSAFPVGRYRALEAAVLLVLSVEPSGAFMVFRDNDLLETGRLAAEEGRLRIDIVSCEAQGMKPSLYGWLYAEDVLSFTAANADPCPERRQLLAEQYEPQWLFAEPLHLDPTVGD